jgi:hypothetical protein
MAQSNNIFKLLIMVKLIPHVLSESRELLLRKPCSLTPLSFFKVILEKHAIDCHSKTGIPLSSF